jgi:aspartyl-tRNA(Asn)/glutamyl-tRNA(Gln) amidotransferase subunit A
MQGIPYGVKDIFDVAGVATTCYSKLHLHSRAQADSAVVAALRAAGAVLLGKLATHEFAFYGPDFDLPFPPARNPWDLSRLTGGSSTGSGAAIAAGLLRFATGSDTGGSIRHPSTWCGLVGLKPTFGLLPRRGVFPLSWSFDVVGPLTRSVEDCAIALKTMTGAGNAPAPDYRQGLELGVRGFRVGLIREFLSHVDAEVLAGVEDVASMLREDGAVVDDVVLPPLAEYGATARVIIFSEGFHVHRKALQEHLDDFGPVNGKRLILGAAYSASDYIAALSARRLLAAKVQDVLQRYDVLLCATLLRTAPRFDEPSANPFNPSKPSPAVPFNLSGNPAMSVPIGLDAAGLPRGVQIVGRLFDEATLLRVGRAIEKRSGWEGVAMLRFDGPASETA